jgi:hypothetical protein
VRNVKRQNMTHTEWTEVVEMALEGKTIKKNNENWLYREAYYDDYDVYEALTIALDPDQKFGVTKGGWGPKGAK